MKRALVVLALLSLAPFALAQRIDETNGKHTQLYPTKDRAAGWARPGGGGAQNLSNHGGPVITTAKTVAIFWGPSWGSNGNLNAVASELLNFYAQFGTTPEYNVITQYSNIQLTGLGQVYWVDTNNPPTAVTDTAIQNEVIAYLNQHPFDGSTIYEVFLPSTS